MLIAINITTKEWWNEDNTNDYSTLSNMDVYLLKVGHLDETRVKEDKLTIQLQ
jgi:hypothetical protein